MSDNPESLGAEVSSRPSSNPEQTINSEGDNPQAGEPSREPISANERRHTSLEKLAFCIAFLALCGTLWQGFVAFDVERRTLRAYVFVDTVRLLNFDSLAYTEEVKIKNTGRTPAYNVVQWAASGIAEFPVPKEGLPPPAKNSWSSVDTMPSEATFEVNVSRLFKDGNKTTMQMGIAALWVYGRVDYEDIFRRKYWTTFRFYVGGDIGINGDKMASAKEGNDADRHCDSWFDR